jgi:hypothetical protein
MEDGIITTPMTADDKHAWWGWGHNLRDTGVIVER